MPSSSETIIYTKHIKFKCKKCGKEFLLYDLLNNMLRLTMTFKSKEQLNDFLTSSDDKSKLDFLCHTHMTCLECNNDAIISVIYSNYEDEFEVLYE